MSFAKCTNPTWVTNNANSDNTSFIGNLTAERRLHCHLHHHHHHSPVPSWLFPSCWKSRCGFEWCEENTCCSLCVYKKIVWGFCDPCAAWAGPCRAVWFDEKCAAAALSVRQPLWSRVLEVLELSSCHPLCMPHTECAATVRTERTD